MQITFCNYFLYRKHMTHRAQKTIHWVTAEQSLHFICCFQNNWKFQKWCSARSLPYVHHDVFRFCCWPILRAKLRLHKSEAKLHASEGWKFSNFLPHLGNRGWVSISSPEGNSHGLSVYSTNLTLYLYPATLPALGKCACSLLLALWSVPRWLKGGCHGQLAQPIFPCLPPCSTTPSNSNMTEEKRSTKQSTAIKRRFSGS